MKNLFLLLAALPIFAFAADKPEVCYTLRGNGFRISSHFGAMAKLVEAGGLPDVVVGSSSGSMSAFLLDSVALYPNYSQDPAAKNLEAALLLKSIPEFMVALISQPEIKKVRIIAADKGKQEEVKQIMADLDRLGMIAKLIALVKHALTSSTLLELYQIQKSPYFKEILNPEFVAYIKKTGEFKKQLKVEKNPDKKQELETLVAYRSKQTADALASADKFDVRSDVNLLFRNGVLNHRGMVKIWDRFASFYAGYNVDAKLKAGITGWVKHCAPESGGKNFDELANADPFCRTQFQKMANYYLKAYNQLGSRKTPNCADVTTNGTCAKYRYEDLLDKKTNSFIITSVFLGDSADNYGKLASEFPLTTDPQFGSLFKVKFQDFRIGYYGNLERTLAATQALKGTIKDSSGRSFDFSNDFKGAVSYPINNATWMEAIIKSSAEPGQARPQIIADHNNVTMLSVGGWPDPIPTQLLKGLGCKTSIGIVTTVKLGNNFGEQIMKKIFADMTGLNDLTEEDIAFGSQDFTSNWGVWRNMANPKGSEQFAFQATEGVYCTDWDELNPFGKDKPIETNLRDLANEGYRGKFFIPEDVGADQPIRSFNVPQIKRADNVWSEELKRPKHNGCIPPPRPLAPVSVN